tara:strand:+ start:3554 stop:4090 length:537 start_codon:yes stop_codon:yes gene_type:complete
VDDHFLFYLLSGARFPLFLQVFLGGYFSEYIAAYRTREQVARADFLKRRSKRKMRLDRTSWFIEPEHTVILIDIPHMTPPEAQTFKDMDEILKFYRDEAKSTDGSFETWCYEEERNEDDPSSFKDWHSHDLNSSYVFECKNDEEKGELAARFKIKGGIDGHGHDAVRIAIAFWKEERD